MMVGGKLEQISSQLVTLPLSLLLKRGPAVPPQKSLYLLLKRQQGWRAVSHLSHHHHTYSRVSRCPISLSFEEEGEGPGGIVGRHSEESRIINRAFEVQSNKMTAFMQRINVIL